MRGEHVTPVRGLSAQEKRDLLERLLRDRLSPSVSDLPLSYNQRSIWFMHCLAPDSAAYNVPYVFRIPSPFDVDALRRAFRALIARHSILRTTYSAHEPVQHVGERTEPDFESTDASRWSESEVWAVINEEAHRPFDLTHGPVLRVRVYERGSVPGFLAMTFHHIAYDLWSMMTLVDEFSALYKSERTGVPPALPRLEYQYADFVRWQSRMLSFDGDRLWSYWKQQLSGELPALQLPTDRVRPAVQSYGGATHRREVPRSLVTGTYALARAEQTTVFPVLLSVFQVLLHSLTGQADILVGSPIAGRSRTEFENLIGYFLNTLPLRSQISGDPEFRAFLRQTHQVVRGALEHQDYPVELLAERLKVARSAAHAAFFQAMFVLNRPHRVERQHSDPPPAQTGSGHELQLEHLPFDLQSSQFDLSLQIDQIEESLVAIWEYNDELFDESTIAGWAHQFERLLEAIIDNSACRLSQLPAPPPAATD